MMVMFLIWVGGKQITFTFFPKSHEKRQTVTCIPIKLRKDVASNGNGIRSQRMGTHFFVLDYKESLISIMTWSGNKEVEVP